MYKVKIFGGQHTKVEEDINNWLDENPGIAIIQMTPTSDLSVMPAGATKMPPGILHGATQVQMQTVQAFFVTILYQEGGEGV